MGYKLTTTFTTFTNCHSKILLFARAALRRRKRYGVRVNGDLMQSASLCKGTEDFLNDVGRGKGNSSDGDTVRDLRFELMMMTMMPIL